MNQKLIELLKDARLAKNLKQEDVAKVLGVKKNTISNYETGKSEPDIDSFITICDLYEIDYTDTIYRAYGEQIKTAPATEKRLAEADENLEVLIENYKNLNEEGQENLVNYSDVLVSSGKYKQNIKNNPLCLGKEA